MGVGIAVVSMILEFIALSGMSGRSFSNDPQVQIIIDQFLQKAIENKSAQEDVANDTEILSSSIHTKMKRNARNSSPAQNSSRISQDLLQFLVNTDQKLLAVQNNWREATKENR